MESGKRSIWIKVCGLLQAEDVASCVELGVNAIGFNFYRESPRYVSPDKAAQLREQIPASMEVVGVFVNSTREEIESIVARVGLSTIQFHGDEGRDMLSDWGELKILPAFRLQPLGEQELEVEAERINSYQTERVLLDAYCDTRYGGTGKQIARPVLATVLPRLKPTVVLSGGLRPESIQEILQDVAVYGVDVASGVERAPGKKDPALLARFVEQVRGVSQLLQ